MTTRKDLRKHNGNNGYILKSYKGSLEEYKYLWSLSGKIEFPRSAIKQKAARRMYHEFIVHLRVSTCLRSIKNHAWDEQITVPISCRLIEREFGRDFDVDMLKKHKIIQITRHSHSARKCKEFRLSHKHFNQAQSISFSSVIDEWQSIFERYKYPYNVNLFNGRQLKTVQKHRMSTKYKNIPDYEIPLLIKHSLKSLQPCPINPHSIIPWLKRANDNFIESKRLLHLFRKNYKQKHPKSTVIDMKGHPKYKTLFQKYNKAQGLLNNMLIAIRTICNQNPTLNGQFTDNKLPLIQYKAAYMPQLSGRVSEIHGGFQTLTTPCKKLLLGGVPNIYNYDLKNSQAMILADELKICGFPCDWLEQYIATDNMKTILAKKIGVSVGCWKECFYSVVMGADTGKFGAVFKSIRKEVLDYDEAEVVRNKFIRIIQPMLSACEKWRNHVLLETPKRYMYRHNGLHWKNACKMVFKGYEVDDTEDTVKIIDTDKGVVITSKAGLEKVKRKLAAFILQGREAFFIHNLTIACSKHQIPVYKNEHDGIITGKKIPETLTHKIAKEVGLPSLKLDIKSICNDTKWKSFTEYLSSTNTPHL